jgi:hypothetical protein
MPRASKNKLQQHIEHKMSQWATTRATQHIEKNPEIALFQAALGLSTTYTVVSKIAS